MSELKVCSWNVQGLHNEALGYKLDTPEAKAVLTNNDIIGLIETHASDSTYINIQGYKTVATSSRPKPKFARKYSGGITVLVKEKIQEGVSYIPSPNIPHDIIWIKLGKAFFHWENDIFMAFTYISPENYSYSVRVH